MYRVPQHDPPAALRKIFCSSTGMTCTLKAEGQWANGLIHATKWRYDGAAPELKIERPKHALMMTLGGASEWERIKISGSPVYEGRIRAGCVSYTPANIEGQAWYRNYNADRLYLLIDPAFLRSFEAGPDALGIPYFLNARDPLLESVLWALAREMGHGAQRLPSVYVEHAAGFLMAHLLRSARRCRLQHLPRAGLSDMTLRRVIEFIEDNLGLDISLRALAALAGTGVDVFARNFKASMGMPPYRYVLERRLRRAQLLLAASERSLAEIAFETGFSSQAHFTTQFSKIMDLSPGTYRALHRG